MKLLTKVDSWLTKLGLAPVWSDEKPSLQQLKNLIERTATEGRKGLKPKYYTHPHGQYADFRDFDTDRMIEDLSGAFPTIPKDEVRRVVMHGIYQHYLR